MITVRGTAFEAAEVEGGAGAVEDGQFLLQQFYMYLCLTKVINAIYCTN